MIPAAFAGIEQLLAGWLFLSIRPAAAFFGVPALGAAQVPAQVRIAIAFAIGIAMAGTGVEPPALDVLLSPAGVLLVAGEILVGAAIGLLLQMAYAAAMIAGEAIGNAMGLGFAILVDPTAGHGNNVAGQLLAALAGALLLVANGHLVLIEAVAASYAGLPPGAPILAAVDPAAVASFAGNMFAAGVAIALPVGTALVLMQLLMAVVARSAPQLNLFAIGFPAVLFAGLFMLWVGLPEIAAAMLATLESGLSAGQGIAGN